MPNGKWEPTNEAMSAAAARYQSFVTGKAANQSYKLNGRKFDGFKNGTLLEAKSGHLKFINPKTGKFHEWFKESGLAKMLKQAKE